MNIKQALKQKNKLAKKIADRAEFLHKENCVVVGAVRNYDPKIQLQELFDDVYKLVELKTAIHLANAEVYEKIFKMSELKNLCKILKGIDTKEGVVHHSRYGESSMVNYESIIKNQDKVAMIESLENEIEELQDELDAHNASRLIV
jgi:predicted SPOUT superfamily RNA methylase MTH1